MPGQIRTVTFTVVAALDSGNFRAMAERAVQELFEARAEQQERFGYADFGQPYPKPRDTFLMEPRGQFRATNGCMVRWEARSFDITPDGLGPLLSSTLASAPAISYNVAGDPSES